MAMLPASMTEEDYADEDTSPMKGAAAATNLATGAHFIAGVTKRVARPGPGLFRQVQYSIYGAVYYGLFRQVQYSIYGAV
jgi:hypothetical protein